MDIFAVSFEVDLVRCSFVSLHQWSQFNQTAASCICIQMGKILAIISLAKSFEQLAMQSLQEGQFLKPTETELSGYN